MKGLVAKALSATLAAAAAVAVACGDTSVPADEEVPLPERDAAPESAAGMCGDTPVDTASDPKNCGACGNVCAPVPHGAVACTAGKCGISCESGFADCNGQPADGCEANLATDILSCGACGRGCARCGGTVCAEGICDAKTVVTSATPGVLHVTLDAARVYFSTDTNVQQVDKDGTNGAVVFGVTGSTGVGADTLVNLVVPGTTGGSGIYRTSAGFVGPQAPYQASGRNVVALSVDATGLYYAVEKSAGLSEVMRCNNCGANPSMLLPNENAVAVAGITLDTTSVFVGVGDTIRRVEKTGADPKTLVVGQSPRSLSTDETHIYWINKAPLFFGDAGAPTGEVARMPKAGGPVEKLATAIRLPLFLAAASSGVYFSDRGLPNAKEGSIVRLSADGKTRLTLARGLEGASGVAVDDACVYFGDGSTVKKVTR